MEINAVTILIVIGGVVIGWFLSSTKAMFAMKKCQREAKESNEKAQSEIKEYQEHLNRHMKITGEGNKNLEGDLEKLKKDNENLRISVKSLGQKPGRAELRLLNIYDSALRKMMLKAPGFSSAWEVALQEAEREYEENERGFKTIIKKVFGPSITHQSETTQMQKQEQKEGFHS